LPLFQILPKLNGNKLDFVTSTAFPSKISQLFTIKDHQPTLLRLGVVYKLTCSCGEAYIGETIRNLKIRLREHATRFVST